MKNITVKELQDTVNSAFSLISTFGPTIFNFIDMKVTEDNLEQLCGLLRALTTWRKYISGYEMCIDNCKKYCLDNDIDPYDIMFGMI